MRYKNYGSKDPIGKLLQFSIDYSYVKHHAPGQITKEAKALNALINIGILAGLCLLVAWANK